MLHRSAPLTAMLTLTAFVLALAGCGSAAPAAPPASPTAAGHGAVDGAKEVSEAPVAAVTIDPDGVVRQLDLLDESVDELGGVPAASRASTDGRYVFADTGEGLSIIDSGRWTWDHVDHFHYYLAEPAMLGEVPGRGAAAVATTSSSTTGSTGVFFAGSGEAVLLDTAAMADGELVERFRLETDPHDGMLVPIGSHALITEPQHGVAASVSVLDEDGVAQPGGTAECEDARGTVTTRVGAVIGCADGALLATVVDGAVELERIPYPADTTAPRATGFAGRDGRPTVAGLAGEQGIWLLDTRERTFTLLPVDRPILQATAVDDEAQHVLAVAADGRVLVIDGASGALLSQTEPLVAESLAAGTGILTLVADQERAYLNGPAEHTLYEIDFADAARISRTFQTPTQPSLLAETGR
ncbi:ABC transporter [Microbacterium ureisolvens]|uniref:ABC transporter n=1 Tax=Microbacterium ureisolvens TaxID=2781186 RepID=A0ABS7HZ69_9MICO|nr:ABC transporter [Microbacterium ureisolvens]MBW9110573.1 ABC transporter [Microbacterium ureisolvens]